MEEIIGTSNKILEVDLTTGNVEIVSISQDERYLFLGSKGLGLKLLYDRLEPGIDPLGEKNIIAFMPGVLMGSGAPCSGRFHAVTKSPLTNILTSSSCGGPFGMNLKTAGWDGLIVKGRASRPACLIVTKGGVTLEEAEKIWGLDALSAQMVMGGKGTGTLTIGPAGEHLIRYANIVSGERHLGRGGMGAVMGSKHLKGIIAHGGEFKIRPKDRAKFTKAKKRASRYIESNESTSIAYRNFGTLANLNINNTVGILPVHNFRDGRHEKAYQISGEFIKERYGTTHHTCKPCTILCGHKGNFEGNQLPVPEYETVSLLGSNLGIFDAALIAKWNRVCSELGMDTISAGGTIAWVMEAAERGIVESPLKFGASEGITETLHDIAYGRGFGKEMALGTRSLSERYGGETFAIQVKGLEMAAYDPRGSFGQGLSYAVANRGACHLSAFTTGVEVLFGLLNPYSTAAKAEFTKFFEDIFCCINSLQTCVFTSFACLFEPPLVKYSPYPLLRFLMQNLPKMAISSIDFSVYTDLWSGMTGLEMSNRAFLRAGGRIHVLERFMNTREGISRKDDTLPERLLKEGRASDEKQRTVPLERMLDEYYKLRGYDDSGIPTEKTLKKLGII
jgi:aldehyde:ferredoxin oxidoreductase